jgi:hypothetical protein
MCLGGINMVDYDPWRMCDPFSARLLIYPVPTEGNYTNTVVRDNTIFGGFASDEPDSSTETKGVNDEDAIVKSVAGGSPSLSFRAKYTSSIGSVLRLDPELGLVTGISRTLVPLAQS